MSYGAPGCLSLAGTVLDEFVAGQVLQVLAPASLELSLAAEQALRAERVQLEGHWQQRLKRARYAVERAARQYAAVEPENRLVARELEKGWEKALRHEQHEQEAYARFRQERPAELTPRQCDAIRRLSHDVPGLWHAPPTTAKDRQEIVRLLLERVIVDVQGESEQVAVTLQWAGGFRSAHNGSCTWPLRVNISDFPFDCYRNKKVWTRGLLWPSSGLLPPGDGRDACRADTRRPLSPPPLTASHHRSVLTPLLVEATAGRERAAPHGPCHHNTFLSITATIALRAESRQQCRVIRNQVVAGHSVTRGRQGTIADTCVEPIAMHSQFLGQAKYCPLFLQFRLAPESFRE